jgi:hypothetical protein
LAKGNPKELKLGSIDAYRKRSLIYYGEEIGMEGHIEATCFLK